MFCVQIVGVDERVFAGVGGGEGDGPPRGRPQLVHVDLEGLAQGVESAVVPDVGRHEVELEVGVAQPGVAADKPTWTHAA